MKVNMRTISTREVRTNFLKEKVMLGIEMFGTTSSPKLVKKITIINSKTLLKLMFKSSI